MYLEQLLLPVMGVVLDSVPNPFPQVEVTHAFWKLPAPRIQSRPVMLQDHCKKLKVI
jgi:hypothetical protein